MNLWAPDSEQGVVKDFGAFSDTSNEITLGWRWKMGAAGILEAGLVENIVSFDNSPDFGIHLGFARRF